MALALALLGGCTTATTVVCTTGAEGASAAVTRAVEVDGAQLAEVIREAGTIAQVAGDVPFALAQEGDEPDGWYVRADTEGCEAGWE